MKQVIVIPARFQSSRLPGKPLVMIAGKSLLHRVWERCVAAMDQRSVFIATDDNRIAEHGATFGAQVVMTPESCLTGTDRLYEANKILQADSVINVQGDEPLVEPRDIANVARRHRESLDVIFNGMGPISSESEYRSPTVPKVVATPEGRLLYMSRAGIPANKALTFRSAMKQICIYGFSKDHLKAFGQYQQKTPLEEQEDIEILRFLELGYQVQMVSLESPAIAVDVPEDVGKVEQALVRLGLV